MVRNLKRKTPSINKDAMKKAVVAVRKENLSKSAAARLFGVSRSTLNDWLKINGDTVNSIKNMLSNDAKDIYL